MTAPPPGTLYRDISGERSVRDCGVADAAPAAPTPTPRVVECPGCGGTFTTTVDTKLYCSTACKVREKRRRERARRPAAPPPPRKAECVDCGAPLNKVEPVGATPKRCAPCRVLRASERALQRRREEHAERARLSQPGQSAWRRLFGGWSR